jgi:antitoxin HicB
MRYHFKVHREKGGYWAEGMELKGCRSEGDTREELLRNLKEAMDVYLAEPSDSSLIFPLPLKRTPKASNVVSLSVDPHVAFAFLMRQTRLREKLSIRDAAQKLNFANHSSYQALENARRANPELSTIERIREAFPSFPWELVFDRAS